MNIITNINKIEAINKLDLPINVLSGSLALPTQIQQLSDMCLSLQLQNIYNYCSMPAFTDWNSNCNSQMAYFPWESSCSHAHDTYCNSETEFTQSINLNQNNSKNDDHIIRIDLSCKTDSADDESISGKCTKSNQLDKYPHEITYKHDEVSGKPVKVFKCMHEGCTKEFSKSWNLIYHARVHTNEKPFKCTHCRESFAQKGNLKRHLKIHSETALAGRKKLQCDICLKKYTTKFNLKVHKQTKHPEHE